MPNIFAENKTEFVYTTGKHYDQLADDTKNKKPPSFLAHTHGSRDKLKEIAPLSLKRAKKTAQSSSCKGRRKRNGGGSQPNEIITMGLMLM